MSIYVGGYGASDARLFVCGEAPGKYEEEEGRPFVGPTGQETRSMLRNAGVAPESCFFDNVFHYRPPGNDIKRAAETGHTIEECIPDLWEHIKAVNPNCILALGNLALQTLTGESGIKKWRGSILPTLYHGSKVVPSIHPANLFERRGEKGLFPYSAKVYIQLDFNRAVEESLTKELEIPHRNLHFARRSVDVYDFLKRHFSGPGRKKAALDIEAFHCVPSMLSIAPSRHTSMSIPLQNLKRFDPTFDIPAYDQAEIWRLVDKFLRDESIDFIGQNFKYDQQKLECIGFRLWKLWLDTMLLQKLVNPEFPGALEFITSIYTREPYYKDEYKEFNPARDSIKKILIYNARDSAVDFECMEELLKESDEIGLTKFFFDFVMPLHSIYKEMEEIGLKIDFDARDELYARYVDLQLKKEDELFELIGRPVNCNSTPQIKFLLFEELRVPRRAKVDEETLVNLLGGRQIKDDKRKKILGGIVDIRRIRNAQSKIKSRPDYDGRMRTAYRIAGTEAGRSSTAIQKPPVRPHQMGMSFHSITKHGELGGDIRTMFVPSQPGWVFMNADESQAEARVVAVLSEDEELLQWFADGVDVHARTAAFVFGGEEQRYMKEKGKAEPPERYIGKRGRHAYAYGTSAKKLMLVANTDARRFGIDIQISLWRAGEILKVMDEKCPKISQVYWPTIRAIAHGDRTIRTGWPEGGRVRQFLDRLNDDLYREMYSYIPQAVVSDKTKLAMIKAKKKFPLLRIVLESHDAFCCEGPRNMIEQDVAPYVKEVMEEPIDFTECTISRGTLVIPCDVEIGENYKDLKKLKVA
jgi:uracil-DNA glycosylase family 4